LKESALPALIQVIEESERSEKERVNVRRETVSDLVFRPRMAEDYRLVLELVRAIDRGIE
jgi:hypothetical protein